MAAAAPVAASSSAWADYRPDAEESAYRPQESGVMGAPKGMHMVTDGETDETAQAIKKLPAVKDIGLISQDLKRCEMFFQDGVGSPYVRKELVVTGDPVNPLPGDWVHCYFRHTDIFDGAVVQVRPSNAPHDYFIQTMDKGTVILLSHKNGTFTLSTHTPPDALPKNGGIPFASFTRADSFTFDNFDSAGRKINELLQQLGALPAEEVLRNVAPLQNSGSHILAKAWMNNRFPWKCPVFKSKESMLEWTRNCFYDFRENQIAYEPGKVGDAYYLTVRKDGETYGDPKIYELGFKSRPCDLWDKGSSPVFLKIGNTEHPLIFSALEQHEMGGMGGDEAREKQEQALARRLEEIFGMPVHILGRPVSSCETWCDILLLGCGCWYYCCCWDHCCNTI